MKKRIYSTPEITTVMTIPVCQLCAGSITTDGNNADVDFSEEEVGGGDFRSRELDW